MVSDFRRTRPRQPGFTLVELLVVIAIIGILVALLLPAIQAAREAARRVSCQNKVKNLALAVLNYENAKKGLPPACIALPTSGEIWAQPSEFEGDLSWIVRILPQLEEQAIYDKFDLKKSIKLQATDLVTKGDPQAQQPTILLCPSDTTLNRFYVAGPSDAIMPSGRFGKGNYAAYVSPEHVSHMRVFSGALINEPQPLGRVVDGTSKTLLIAEVRSREVDRDPRGVWAAAFAGGSILGFDLHSRQHKDVTASSPRNAPYAPFLYTVNDPGLPPNTSATWSNRDYVRECPSQAQADADGLPCTTQSASRQSAAPRSLHNGGVNVAHIDGSVEFLSNDIDQFLMARTVSINDSQGEVVGE